MENKMEVLKHILKLLPSIGVVIFLTTLGGTSKYFIDIPSVAIILVLPTLLLLVNYKFNEILKFHKLAFAKTATSTKEIEQGITMFKSLGQYYILIAALGFLTGMVHVLANIGNPSEIGPPLAVAILTY